MASASKKGNEMESKYTNGNSDSNIDIEPSDIQAFRVDVSASNTKVIDDVRSNYKIDQQYRDDDRKPTLKKDSYVKPNKYVDDVERSEQEYERSRNKTTDEDTDGENRERQYSRDINARREKKQHAINNSKKDVPKQKSQDNRLYDDVSSTPSESRRAIQKKAQGNKAWDDYTDEEREESNRYNHDDRRHRQDNRDDNHRDDYRNDKRRDRQNNDDDPPAVVKLKNLVVTFENNFIKLRNECKPILTHNTMGAIATLKLLLEQETSLFFDNTLKFDNLKSKRKTNKY